MSHFLNAIGYRLILALLFLFPLEQIHARTEQSLSINIFSINNGVGLEVHRKILRQSLESLGHKVQDREFNEAPNHSDRHHPADINIFMEIINVQWLDCARLNWLVPDPEWYLQDISLLKRIDLILCFTHEAERIFQELGKATYFSGFTSLDCHQNEIEKNYNHFFHLAGRSSMKGTHAISEAWRSRRSLPLLTVISQLYKRPFIQENLEWIFGRVPENKLRHLQNGCGIHLCPSETEGFGHYIMEAMSAGAVVVTTDAPPMNEFITDKRCLVPFQKTDKCALATRYFIAPEDLEKTIGYLRLLPDRELKEIGENNRSMYLQKTHEFTINLEKLLCEIQENLADAK